MFHVTICIDIGKIFLFTALYLFYPYQPVITSYNMVRDGSSGSGTGVSHDSVLNYSILYVFLCDGTRISFHSMHPAMYENYTFTFLYLLFACPWIRLGHWVFLNICKGLNQLFFIYAGKVCWAQMLFFGIALLYACVLNAAPVLIKTSKGSGIYSTTSRPLGFFQFKEEKFLRRKIMSQIHCVLCQLILALHWSYTMLTQSSASFKRIWNKVLWV